MGRLLKALERPSSYAVKKTDWWAEITDQIAGAMFPAQLDEVEQMLAAKVMQFPRSWEESLAELIEKKREEIASEDIGQIVRDRYDFT